MGCVSLTGRIFFVVAMIAFCIHQMIYAELKPVFISTWPVWITSTSGWAYFVNILLIVAFAAMMIRLYSIYASLFAATLLLLFIILNHLPFQLSTNLHFIGGWTDSLKALAICGGIFIVGLSHPKMPLKVNTANILFVTGRIFFAVPLIIFGIEHFLYREFVATLVPSWIPGHMFWTYIAGVGLIAAGIAIMFNIQGQMAAWILASVLFIWFAVLHIPRGIADPYSGNGNEIRSIFQSLAFSGVAFVLAERFSKRTNY